MSEAAGALRRHIERKLERAELNHSPFPHIVVPDLFPAELYADVLRFNPFATNPGSEWLPREQSDNVSTHTPYFARKQIDVAAGEPIGGAPGAAALWAVIRETFLAGDWFARLVAAKCDAYFRLRFGDLLDDEDFFSLMSTQLFLQRHEPGFELGAHTDLPTRIFTCIFSFADREGFEESGTQLLAHEDRLVRCWGTDHHVRDAFVVKKLVPYRPNGFLLFLKTRHSFHAVAKVDERVPNQRYGMQFQFHEPAGGVFRDLSEPELMQFPRPRAPR
ncbi:MAG TPA: hypothetical protein VHS78_06675 [Candidatus Elarobacter sp.]|nr:hypothetical protein [Candidatus Elarobacter sp.]